MTVHYFGEIPFLITGLKYDVEKVGVSRVRIGCKVKEKEEMLGYIDRLVAFGVIDLSLASSLISCVSILFD